MPMPKAVAPTARSWPIMPSSGSSSAVDANGSEPGSQTARSASAVS
jgi:hypothetical protein